MKYTLSNAKVVNIPDKDLEKLQNLLDISREEAIHTWLVDNDYEIDAEADELTEKAKKSGIMHTIHGAKAENSEKKERKPREKKENPLKKQIISHIFNSFFYDNVREDYPNLEIVVKNDEKYIDLCVDGVEFTINLVQHRPKK
jgi:hypothetical protein